MVHRFARTAAAQRHRFAHRPANARGVDLRLWEALSDDVLAVAAAEDDQALAVSAARGMIAAKRHVFNAVIPRSSGRVVCRAVWDGVRVLQVNATAQVHLHEQRCSELAERGGKACGWHCRAPDNAPPALTHGIIVASAKLREM